MLKFLLYLGLSVFGVVGTFFNPLIGAVSCIGAYLLNPSVISMPGNTLRFQLITTVAFLLSCLLHRPQGLPRVGREGALLGLMWAFIAMGFLSCTWAVISAEQGFWEMVELFKTALVAAVFVRVIRSGRDMSILILACVIGVWHASLLHTIGTRLGYVPAFLGREYGVLPEGQMAVLILFFPLLIMLIVHGSNWERIISFLALPFVLNSVISTYQRAGLVILCVEVIFLLFLLPKRITLAATPVLLLAGGLFVFRLTPPDYWNKMSTIKTPTEEASANSRFIINQCSRRMLADYPFGVGYRNYLNISHRYLDSRWLDKGKRSPHNTFYTIACELGIPGFLIWATGLGTMALLLRRIRKRADSKHPVPAEVYAMGLEVAIYGWAVGGYFHDMHNVDPIFWFFPFTIALVRLQYQSHLEQEVDADDSVDADIAETTHA